MENLSKFSKILIFFTLFSFIVFLGSYVTKLLLINQFFDAKTMELKSVYLNKDLILVLQFLSPAFFVNILFYGLFLFFFVFTLVYTKVNLRNYGWLFIIVATLVMTTPFEIYLLIKYDCEIIRDINYSLSNQNTIIDLLSNRITELGPFPLILLFSNILIIFLATFKPLQKV